MSAAGRLAAAGLFLAACATASLPEDPAGGAADAALRGDAAPDGRGVGLVDARDDVPSVPDARIATVVGAVQADFTYASDVAAPILTCTGLPRCDLAAFDCSTCGLLTAGGKSAAIVNGTGRLDLDLAGVAAVTSATVTVEVRDLNSSPTTCSVRNQSLVATALAVPPGPAFSVLATPWTTRLEPGAANSVEVARSPGTTHLLLRRVRVDLAVVLE